MVKRFMLLLEGRNGENYFDAFMKDAKIGDRIDDYCMIDPNAEFVNTAKSVNRTLRDKLFFLKDHLDERPFRGCFRSELPVPEGMGSDKLYSKIHLDMSLMHNTDFSEYVAVGASDFGIYTGRIENGSKSGLLVYGKLEPEHLSALYSVLKENKFLKDTKMYPVVDGYWKDSEKVLEAYNKSLKKVVNLTPEEKITGTKSKKR